MSTRHQPQREPHEAEALRRFGDRVGRLRSEAGINQDELAARADIQRSHMHLIEAGKSDVRLLTVLRLSAALGVSLEMLLAQDARP